MTARRRRWIRNAAIAMVVLVCASAALSAWLVRDPRARFAERHGELVEAIVEERVDTGENVEELVTLRSSSGLRLQLATKRSKEPAPAHGRPVAVVVGGQDTGRTALRFVGDTRGVLCVALSYPYEGPRKPKGLAVLPAVPAIRTALLDTPSAISLALDWLLALPDVDRARVELVGVSLGAPFACIGGALDARITRVWSLHGGGDPYALVEANLRKQVSFAPARHALVAAAWVLANGRWLAPERWVADISPRPFVMVNARDDERIPRACVDRLWNAAREPKEIVWLDGQHVKPKRIEVVRSLVDSVMARVAGDERPSADGGGEASR